jgi:hypothetical protein
MPPQKNSYVQNFGDEVACRCSPSSRLLYKLNLELDPTAAEKSLPDMLIAIAAAEVTELRDTVKRTQYKRVPFLE